MTEPSSQRIRQPRPAEPVSRGSCVPGFDGMKKAAVAGTTLAYHEEGQGEPVVFVHGGISDSRTWTLQLPAIGASYRAISLSRRYARPNDDIPPGTDDQMLPHVEDLVAFLRSVQAVPAHLAGNSWGAFICLLTAIRHPEVVRTLLVRLTDRLEELLPNVERVEIPAASHFMHEDNAAAVNQAILDFLGRHRQIRPATA